MSFRRRRFRPQPVQFSGAHSPETFSDAGDPYSYDLAVAAPRPLVHRLLTLDSVSDGDWSTGRGYGGRPESPIKTLRRAFPRVFVRASAGVSRQPNPLQAQRRRALDWRAFNALRVAVPQRVRFCIQRKSRREVLFAFRVAGRRGSAPGPYRRRVESSWSCA